MCDVPGILYVESGALHPLSEIPGMEAPGSWEKYRSIEYSLLIERYHTVS